MSIKSAKYVLIKGIVILFLHGCSGKPADTGLRQWNAEFSFEEEPIDAGGGNIMTMDWQFKATINDSVSEAVLEVNGQTTYLKIKTALSGDSTTLNVLYESLLEGVGDNLQKNDTLFLLRRTKDSLVTEWRKMQPMLRENQPLTCRCFN